METSGFLPEHYNSSGPVYTGNYSEYSYCGGANSYSVKICFNFQSGQDLTLCSLCKGDNQCEISKENQIKTRQKGNEALNRRSQNHRITESQNGRGWKGPLWVI